MVNTARYIKCRSHLYNTFEEAIAPLAWKGRAKAPGCAPTIADGKDRNVEKPTTDHIIPLEEAILAISILNILQYGNVG